MSARKPAKRGGDDGASDTPSREAPKKTPPSSSSSSSPSSPSPSSSHKGKGGWLKWTVVLATLVVATFALLNHYATHVFDPAVMQRIAQASLAAHPDNLESQFEFVISELRKEYPGHILDNSEWIFNNAGGAMGAMIVLHASVSEYVIIFGTPVGTEGHSGRFFADDYFTILHGEQWAFAPGALTREVYKAGDQHHLPWGVAKQYRMDDACWALEYARGSIPSMMPFGLADAIFSTLDVVTLAKTIKVSAVAMATELMKGKI